MVAVVCQPDRRRGRGRKTSPAPVAQVALEAAIPLLRPERVGTPEVADALERHAPDLGVVVAFGQFIPKQIRELPGLGFLVNGHASLLPRHRGAAPIARAILAGDSITGVSAMRVERAMDAGPVALQRELAIGPEENAGELGERLAVLTADVIEEVVDRIARRDVVWTPQNDALATEAPKLERADAALDWHDTAVALVRRVRAMAPAPGAATTLGGDALRILAARAEPGRADARPGTVRSGGAQPVAIATADGWLVPSILQRAGKRPVDVEAFLRGKPIPDGTVLGDRAQQPG